MGMAFGKIGVAMVLASCLDAGAAWAQSDKMPPYWASISKSEAMMRVGPGQDFPANWLYRRQDLPVKVVEVHGSWRRIEDSEGTVGWMHVRLLRDDPTAVVKGEVAEMRDGPMSDSKLLHRLAPGVIGHISGCAAGWCAFETGGKRGYVRSRNLWGAVDEE